MALPLDVALAEPERFTGSDAQLVLDEIASGDGLRDRVLHLEARVDLQEEEVASLSSRNSAVPAPT